MIPIPTVRVLESPEEIESVRALWVQWQIHPNTDLDHFLLVCRVRKNVRRPHIIVVSYGDAPRAILVGRLEDGVIAPSIGYYRPIRLSVVKLTILHWGLLGEVDDSIAKALLDALHSALKNKEADVVELEHLAKESPLLLTALATSRLWRDGTPSWSTHWELTLPRPPGGLLQQMSSKHRSWIRRKARELEQAFPDQVKYESFAVGDDVEILCQKLEQIARVTYQRSIGGGFVDDRENRERFQLFAQRGLLRAWTLSLGDKPVAYCVGCVYKDTFYFSTTGYDPTLRSHEVGTLIFLRMVDDLGKESVAKFNFGFGDAHYKKRFGDRSWNEGSLQLYAPTLKGLTSRVSTGVFNTTTMLTRKVINRLGLFDRLKTMWRKRISRTATSPEPAA